MKKSVYIIVAVIVSAALIGVIINSLAHHKGKAVTKRPNSNSLTMLYNKANELESKGAYLDAQTLYNRILDGADDEKLIQRTRDRLEEINMKILFSPIVTKDSMIYTVQKGDTLGKIAKRFNTTVGLIMRSNNLKNDTIRVAQRLKISKAKYSVLIDYSDNTLILKSDGAELKRYTVATGVNNSTPIGTFKIINKLKDPVWYKTGAVVPSGSPDNILSTRWMGLSVSGYGIHGTTKPESIGRHVTAGCVRMKDAEVQELYDILPVGTEVTITD